MVRSTKKALIVSVMSLLLCAAMLIGTTFAWFTDIAESKNNKIEAGTLQVELWEGNTNISNSETPIFSLTTWEPGYSDYTDLTVKNVGTLALKYQLVFQNIVTTGNADITEVLDVTIGETYVGTLKEVNDSYVLATGELLAKTEVKLDRITVKMQETAGNQYQGCGVTFDVQLRAIQHTYEADGFGNTDYDAGARFPEIVREELDNQAQTVINGTNISATIPANAGLKAEGADVANGETLVLDFKPTSLNTNITVAGNSSAETYEVSLETADGKKITSEEYITVSMNIGAGRTGAIELYHYETLIDSTYDSATGMLTYETNGFSPFTVVESFSVKVGDVAYGDLQGAFDAVEAGTSTTVTLISNLEQANTITVEGKDITLDLAGHTLSIGAADSSTDGLVVEDGVLNLVNTSIEKATISYNGTNTSGDPIYVVGGELNFVGNIDVVASPQANSILHAVGASEVTFGDGTNFIATGNTENQFTAFYIERGATLNMTGGTVVVESNLNRDDDSWNNDAVGVMLLGSGCEFNMTGGMIKVHSQNSMAQAVQISTYNGAGDSTITIDGGIFDIANQGERVTSCAFAIFDPSKGTVIVNNATFIGKYESAVSTYYSGKPNITIVSGVFAFDPTEYVQGSAVTENGDGTYSVKHVFDIDGDTVTLLDPAAFELALNAVPDGGKLILPAGKFDAFNAEGKNVKLIGAVDENGAPATTIYFAALPANNDGDGVWEWSEKVEFENIIFEAAAGIEGGNATYQSALNIENGADAAFTNCKFVNMGMHISGNTTFTNCVFEGNDSGYKGFLLAPTKDCEVVVDGCEFSGYTYNSINVQDANNSTLTIKNSTFSGAMIEVGALKALTFENCTLNCDVVAWFSATDVTIPENSFGAGFAYTNHNY